MRSDDQIIFFFFQFDSILSDSRFHLLVNILPLAPNILLLVVVVGGVVSVTLCPVDYRPTDLTSSRPQFSLTGGLTNT